MRHRVELAVELPHRDRLGVEHVVLHLRVSVGPSLLHLAERRAERAVRDVLAPKE